MTRRVGNHIEWEELRPGDYIYYSNWSQSDIEESGYRVLEYAPFNKLIMSCPCTANHRYTFDSAAFASEDGSHWLWLELGEPARKTGFARWVECQGV